MTLPRLELFGAVLAVQLLEFVRKTLSINKNKCTCWIDSMVVLGWIKRNPSRWKLFVANRVGLVQELSEPSCWYHCSGEDNPADLCTRGISATELVESKTWLVGSSFLLSDRAMITEDYVEQNDLSEEKVEFL